jgi:hypothetical protein
MKIAFRYIDRNNKLLWKGVLPGDGNQMTWASFKKEVEKLYPGSDRSAIFLSNDLDVFISTGVSKRITSKDDFAEYCCKFRTITDHLVREGRISELESKKMFPKGLHEDFQASIIRRMEILKPAHPSGMPQEIEDMIKAGRYILDAPETEVGKSADTVFIKKEMVELTDTIAKMNQRYHVDMQTLTQAVNRGMQIGPPQRTYLIYQAMALETVPPRPRYPPQGGGMYQGPYSARDNGYPQQQGGYPPCQPWPPRDGPRGGTMFRPGECRFCSETGHFLRECNVAADYIRSGKCFRNADNRLVLPNSRFLPRNSPGQNLAEKFDRWFQENSVPLVAAQPQPPPQAQAQIFKRDQPPHTVAAMSYTSYEPVQTMGFRQTANPAVDSYEDEEGRIWIQERPKKAGPVQFATPAVDSYQDEYGNVWVQERPKKGKPEVVIQKKGPPRGAQKIADEPQRQQEEPKKAAKPPPPPGDARSHPPQPPAFKYQAPVENPVLVKRVLERALVAEVTITRSCVLSHLRSENGTATTQPPNIFPWLKLGLTQKGRLSS